MPNCTSCSAPLPTKSIICDYCGVRNDIDITPVPKKNFVPLLPSDRYCPDCIIELKSIDVGRGAPFMIEKCTQCYGLFFDNSELEKLLEYSVKSSFFIDKHKVHSLLQNPRHQDKVRYRHCPVCDGLMHRENFMNHSGVIIDVCHTDGVWLDAGELKQIQEWMALGGSHKNTTQKDNQKRHILEARKERKRAENNHQSREKSTVKRDMSPDPYFSLFSDLFF